MRVTVAKAMVVLILAVLTTAPAPAAEEPLSSPGLEQEVRKLNTTLGQLVDLLRRQLESSNAAVLMQRVQLMTTRIAPVEQELRTARAEQQGLQNELDELELAAASIEAQVEHQLEEGEITADEARGVLDRQMFDQRKKQVEDRLWTAQQLVIGLEQRIDSRRTEIETWEGEIDRVLGLR